MMLLLRFSQNIKLKQFHSGEYFEYLKDDKVLKQFKIEIDLLPNFDNEKDTECFNEFLKYGIEHNLSPEFSKISIGKRDEPTDLIYETYDLLKQLGKRQETLLLENCSISEKYHEICKIE